MNRIGHRRCLLLNLPLKTAIGALCLAASLSAQDVTIASNSCSGKDGIIINRNPDEGTGANCGCPCSGATWMGVKGEFYTSRNGNIWYSFPGSNAEYKVTISYQGDPDGAAEYKISVAGKQIGNGEIGGKSGKQTFGPVSIKKGDKVNVWLKSDYKLDKDGKPQKHGNYGRFDKLIFTRTGGGGGGDPEPKPTPEPGPATPQKVAGLKTTDVTENKIALSWNKSNNAADYNIYWTNITNPDATTKGTSYTIEGLEPGKKYSIWVKAMNGSEDAPGTNIEVSTKAKSTPEPAGPPVKKITSPAPQSTLEAGQKLVIKWTPEPGKENVNLEVDLSISPKGETTIWFPLKAQGEKVLNSAGEFTWVIPQEIDILDPSQGKAVKKSIATQNAYILMYEYETPDESTYLGPFTIEAAGSATIMVPGNPTFSGHTSIRNSGPAVLFMDQEGKPTGLRDATGRAIPAR